MKIAIAADHAGYKLKEELKQFLMEHGGHEMEDFGASTLESGDDYPDFVIPAARAVAEGKVDRAIVIGSSGNGEAIAANRIKGVRAMVYYGRVEPQNNNAKIGDLCGIVHEGREDNDSNILSLGASFVRTEEAKKIVTDWLETPFTGEERHKRRIQKLDANS